MAVDRRLRCTITALAWVGAILLVIVIQALVIEQVLPVLLNGQLLGPDSYTWLGHIQLLLEDGSWYDRIQPRANWPYGETQHSSRPFDSVLLAGTWVLTPFLGRDPALFWSGAWVSPVFYLGLCGTVAWTAARAFGRWRGLAAMLLLLTQLPVLAYALPGRVDHHPLLMMVFALSLGLTSRTLQESSRGRDAIIAGAVAGFGVWLSVEFLLVLAASFAVLFWKWMREGVPRTRTGLLFAVGLLAMTSVALALEYRPAAILQPHFDHISSVHLVMALVAVGFWVFIGDWEARRRFPMSFRERLRFGGVCAAVALGLFALSFPGFFASPGSGMDERARIVLLDMVGETRGLLPENGQGFGRLFQYLGVAAIALPVVVSRLIRDRRAHTIDVWTFFAMIIGIYLVASLMMVRFSPYAEIACAMVIADALVRGGIWAFSGVEEGPRPAAARGVAAILVAGVLFAAIWSNASLLLGSIASLPPPCHKRLKDLAAHLNEMEEGAEHPYVIVAMADMGPELLYRTRHRVIATPSLSNQAGAVALFSVFTATSDRSARPVIEERGIDHLLICRALPFDSAGSRDRRLIARLRYGEVPPWLERVPLPGNIAGIYQLFRVRAEALQDL